MLGHRLRRWLGIKPMLGQYLVFAYNQPTVNKRVYSLLSSALHLQQTEICLTIK